LGNDVLMDGHVEHIRKRDRERMSKSNPRKSRP